MQTIIATFEEVKPKLNEIINEEVPIGTIDGVNYTFTLSQTPLVNSLRVLLNGITLSHNDDFIISGNTLTMIQIPWTGCKFITNYLF